jgi:hypothetical protein
LKIWCAFIFWISALSIYGTLATGVAANNCADITIDNCPTLFVEDCNDTEFRNANLNACYNAVTNTGDADFCASAEVSACTPNLECDPDIRNFYEGYNCKRGVPTCPTSAARLNNSFGASLIDLEAALEPYSDVIDFNPNDQDNVANLCERFTVETFEGLLASSTADDTVVQGFEQNLTFLGQCADVAQDLVEGEAPSEVYTAALWASAKVTIENILIGVGEQRSALEIEIESLRGSATKVSPMYGMYLSFCQE